MFVYVSNSIQADAKESELPESVHYFLTSTGMELSVKVSGKLLSPEVYIYTYIHTYIHTHPTLVCVLYLSYVVLSWVCVFM